MFLLSFNQLMCFSFQLYLISYVDVMHDLLNARGKHHTPLAKRFVQHADKRKSLQSIENLEFAVFGEFLTYASHTKTFLYRRCLDFKHLSRRRFSNQARSGKDRLSDPLWLSRSRVTGWPMLSLSGRGRTSKHLASPGN